MKTKILSALILLMSISLFAQSPVKTSLDDFKWLAGSWVGDGFGGISEETWSLPNGGSMMGMYRHIKDGKVTFYEFMNIVEEEDGIKLKIKHFTPEMKGWEEKDEFVTFQFLSSDVDILKFNGLIFKRLSPNKMKIELKLDRNGTIETEIFTFNRKDRSF